MVLIIFRELSDTFSDAICRDPTSQTKIDLEKAKKQHQEYIQECLDAAYFMEGDTKALILPKSNETPDSVFVEDCLIYLGPGEVVLSNPGAPSRKPEVLWLRKILEERLPSDFTIYSPRTSSGTFDGGDILRIGEKLFVGLSDRTNDAGFMELERICQESKSEVRAWPVGMGGKDALHLKSLVTYLGSDVGLVASNTKDGHSVVEQILAVTGQMTVYYVDNALAANMLRIGRTIIYPEGADIGHIQNACKTTHHRTAPIVFRPLDMSELNKKDGALTCCSVILSP